MQAHTLARETGDLSSADYGRAVTSTLIKSFAAAPQFRFNGEISIAANAAHLANRPHTIKAHGAGVSALAIEKFDGRILISGGAEGNLKIWDLEESSNPHTLHTFKPIGTIARSSGDGRSKGHSHGITHLGFFPFDAQAFLSSSFDKTLKMWSTERASLSAEFHLNATVYSHATSPIAGHLLVSCATQHSNVRLVDLKSGSAVQALVAHGGPVLCTAWSPRHEHILASGHADGRVRIWDIRRAGGVVTQLDQEDSLGVIHRFRMASATGMDWQSSSRFRTSAQAHDEAVNGLQWSDDGRYIISAGLDRRIRVWDADTGANTLASFGSIIQNQHATTSTIITPPSNNFSTEDVMIWANEQEILFLNLHQGTVITRLRSPGISNPVGARGSELGRNRITDIAWRSCGGDNRVNGTVMGGGNSVGALYSAHMDGQIRAWVPQIPGPEDYDEQEDLNEDEDAKRKKRKAIDDAYKSLMGKAITFN